MNEADMAPRHFLMEDQAREIGITTIALNVFEHNQPGKAMYQKLG
jgi:ribosomal protein S18 acetylase RimI-like enzyme